MRILFCTNHSYMFWQFRRELIQELLKEHEITISTPFVGHEDDFRAMGCYMIDTPINRRGINPIKDMKLLCSYIKLLNSNKPDLVVTYSIKPNIYIGLLCRFLGIPYCTNVQGLGTAFQNKTFAKLIGFVYKMALKKAKVIFFENRTNADIFSSKGIVDENKIVTLCGAGVNVEYYSYVPYPENEKIHFLYLGRIMPEKGVGELLYAI